MSETPLQPPFQGIRVLELGQYVAVPYCAELLAHGGAEVIKVEPVTGDETRRNSEIIPGEGRQYIVKARGKKGIAIDLSTDAGRDVARQLALSCDIILSNMRPGAIEAAGLAYEMLAPDHPGLIFGEITAFGKSGPDARRPGLDVIVQASSGLTLSGRAWDQGVPVGSEAFLTDYMAGMTLAFGLVTALRERDRTGRGQKVTTSLLQASLALQTATANVIEAVDSWKHEFIDELGETGTNFDAFQRRRGQMGSNRWFYNTYATRDGFVALGAPGRLRGPLMRILGIDDQSVSDPNFVMPDDPRPWIESLTEQARAAVAKWTTADLVAECDEAGVPCAPVRFVEEVVMGEQARANDFVTTFDHPAVGPITMPTTPLNFSDSPYSAAPHSPAYGQHTEAVLKELGLADDEVARLVSERVVGTSETSPFA